MEDRKFNVNQKWNDRKCWCKCKNPIKYWEGIDYYMFSHGFICNHVLIIASNHCY